MRALLLLLVPFAVLVLAVLSVRVRSNLLGGLLFIAAMALSIWAQS